MSFETFEVFAVFPEGLKVSKCDSHPAGNCQKQALKQPRELKKKYAGILKF